MTDEQLIATFLEPNPNKPGLPEARLRESAIAVWALIGSLPSVNDDLTALAESYEISLEAVQAAVAFYRRHQAVIDARIAENSQFVWPYAPATADV